MASFLDLGFLEGLTPIFILLIVFAIVYGLLTKTKITGENKSINAIIALVIGIIIMMSEGMSQVIMNMIPWLIMLGIFMLLLVITYKSLGASDSMIIDKLQNKKIIGWTVAILGLIILVSSIADVYGQQELEATENTTQYKFSNEPGNAGTGDSSPESTPETDTEDFDKNVKSSIYHPRMLGFILIMIISVLAITQLTRTEQ
ncbi:MAG: hypothetical protein ACQEP1_00325 [Nanobdellota archaeon]